MIEEAYLNKVVVTKHSGVQIRHLGFSGAKNFRDLGGYQTAAGQTVRWNLLYRSDALHKLNDTDLQHLADLALERVIDFRAEHEKTQEPDRLPADLKSRVLGLPILDSSTRVWHEARDEFVKNLKNIDPVPYMIQTNVELATRFTPEFKRFLHEVLAANGRPILFHCAAGKDRTGFAAAILLRILGVPQNVVMEDYLLTNQYFFAAHKWSMLFARLMKGKKFADVIKGFMDARPEYLNAAFEALMRDHGSFENYVRAGLGLSATDIERLKSVYLE